MGIGSRLRWRCRRGVRELDVALRGFLEAGYAELTEHQKHKFEELLELQDPVLMDWLYGRTAPTDKELEYLVERIRDAAACSATVG